MAYQAPPLPYTAPPGSLPAPLPTLWQIKNPTAVLIWANWVNVVVVGHYYIVKFGRDVSLQEGINMMFIRQQTRVPVPRVYALFSLQGENYIVQERIHGHPLSEIWHGFDYQQRMYVMEQIEGQLRELRSLPPPNRFGGVWGMPCGDAYLTLYDTAERMEPIATEMGWVAAFVEALELSHEESYVPQEWLRPLVEAARLNRPPVFTHGDFHMGNIMVTWEGDVVIIDWEYAGWAPVYWERGCMMVGRSVDEWTEAIGEFLGTIEYAEEARSVVELVHWVFRPQF